MSGGRPGHTVGSFPSAQEVRHGEGLEGDGRRGHGGGGRLTDGRRGRRFGFEPSPARHVWFASSVEKNSSAVFVFICWGAVVSIPRSWKNARASAATWKASSGRHFIESSTIRVPSGYSHISPTILRGKPSGCCFSFNRNTGPRIESASKPTPAGAC